MKRSYDHVGVTELSGTFGITLDGRPLRSPAKAPFNVPTEKLALAIAAEWDAQGDFILPNTMPLMKLASTAIDRVRSARDAVATEAARFAATDLLCYRAAEPADLRERQQRVWQPLLDWAEEALAAPLVVTQGVIPVAQPPSSLMALSQRLGELDHFTLTAIADLTATCGSLILALALHRGRIDAAAAIDAALLDNLFQIERWGEDEDELKRLTLVRADIKAATRFMALLDFAEIVPNPLSR